jgi:hypothetical protein
VVNLSSYFEAENIMTIDGLIIAYGVRESEK